MRAWRESDLGPFAALNADPEVMRFFPGTLTPVESDALVERVRNHFEAHGYGLWALEVLATGQFIGFTGLALQTFPAPFTPAVEVGWRLARGAWGHGYATEAARVALAIGFEDFGLDEIVSMTAAGNTRSRDVMERLGMTRDPVDDFVHPNIAADSPLQPHVLYRLPRERWSFRPG
jgi:RimJ/RimL family protein N-acetyltransferase